MVYKTSELPFHLVVLYGMVRLYVCCVLRFFEPVCNTSCYVFFLIIFIISLIKHQVSWLIKSSRFRIRIQSQEFEFEVLSSA
jgi:hypothetical protein